MQTLFCVLAVAKSTVMEQHLFLPEVRKRFPPYPALLLLGRRPGLIPKPNILKLRFLIKAIFELL
jgi:hypothetical protein